MSDNYLTASISAWAIIDGIQFDDVISVSATFALNTIPTASVVLAVGFAGAQLGDGVATIHRFKGQIKPRAEASIFVEIKDVTGELIGITPGVFKVFEGYVAGLSYQRSNNHANYSINLVHWLDDLNNSSAINGNWFPGVPHDWAQQATYNTEQQTTNTGVLVPTVTRGLANAPNAREDLWKKVIVPVMERIAGFSGGAYQEILPSGEQPDQVNDAAKKALERMPGKSPNYKPLTLQLQPGSKNIDLALAAYFTRGMGSSFEQNSFWAKILDFGSQFLFAISPAVDWATPVPFCAGLKFVEGESKTITAREYSYANFNTNMSQLLEGIYVYHPTSSMTGVPNGAFKNKRLSYYKVWGKYPPNPQKGLKLFKNAPGWLGNLNPAALSALNAAVFVNDGEPRVGGGLPAGTLDSAAAHEAQGTTVERFAKHWYYTEILQQRYGELAGPLRFDIAPGSIVKIETPLMERELGDGRETPFVVASVISVSYMINAERATAGTSFSIAHMKTEEEHDRDTEKLYTTDLAPMYDQAWRSGPLTEAD
jgi:hypothetical protein